MKRLALVFCITLIPTNFALAQNSMSTRPSLKLTTNYHQGFYDDTASALVPPMESELKQVKLTGQSFRLSYAVSDFDLEIGARVLFPAQPFWSQHADYDLTVAYYSPTVPYLGLSAGYIQTHQTADRLHEDAPAAIIERNRIMSIGTKTAFSPYMFNAIHGMRLQLRCDYLTTFEKTRNFGVEYEVGLGYVYVYAGVKYALMLGHLRNYFDATIDDPEEEDNVLNVRHIYTLNSVGLYFEI